MLSDKLTADNTGYNVWGSGPENEALTNYGYWFSYDSRNRRVSRFIARAGTDFVYDNADRQVMERTPEYEYIFTKYDAFGRVILSGLYTGTNRDLASLKTTFTGIVSKESTSAAQSDYYYTWNTFPALSQTTVTQVNYYDDYAAILKWDANLDFVTKTGYDPRYPSAKGLLTGTRSRLLDGVAGSNNWITTAFYYDDKGTLVQKRSTNQLGGYDNEYYAYNYNSLITKKCIEHNISGQSLIIEEYAYDYDAQLRLTTVKYSFSTTGTAPALAAIAEYTYDDMGRVKTKKVGGIETATYTYNIRNWLESRTGSKFEEKMTYTNNMKSGGKNYFGGNIASLTWKAPTPTLTNDITNADIRGYAFEYDALGRLKNAAYGETANLSTKPKHYIESFTYDKNGNPLTLQRYGRKDNGSFGLIDDLSMPAASYVGNWLREVIDAAGDQSSSDLMEFKDGMMTTTKEEYVYWSSGALMADYNRQICQFAYNYLLLPQSVQWRYGHRIEYVYDAMGMRRTATYRESNKDMAYGPCDNRVPAAGDFLPSPLTRQYMGNKVYENNKLKYILTEEGYIEKTANNDYYTFYYLKDRLGNNRVVMNFNGVADQVNNYYPSGVTMAESPNRGDQGVQPYKFGGKELDRFKNLDFYNFEARAFDPVLMRFTSIDPLAEKYYSISPYVYCADNPANAVDRDGRLVIFINGMHTGTGGTKNYWGDNGVFADAVMKRLKDDNAIYRDGSVGGWFNIGNNKSAKYRFEHGETWGKIDAERIIRLISDDNGNIKETIKIITHSMGAAYAKGYVKELLQYMHEHNISTDLLEFEADFAPYQPTKQNANPEVKTYQFSHSKDKVAGKDKMEGAKYMDTSGDEQQNHGINTFIDQIKNLPAGRYKVENGQVVPM